MIKVDEVLRITKALVLAGSQILLFLAFHEVVRELFAPRINDLSWGLLVSFTFPLFVVLSLSGAFLVEFIDKARFIAPLVSLAIFSAFLLQTIQYRPYRTMLLIVSAALGLFLPSLVRYATQRWSKPTQV